MEIAPRQRRRRLGIGGFEKYVLAVIINLRGKAYGTRIQTALEKHLGRPVPAGQVYVVLGRLKRKGFIATTIGKPTPVRGGRAKTFYTVTPFGMGAWKAEGAVYQTKNRSVIPLARCRSGP